ncbi:MAG: TIGR03016 family PEP-CTERM system-associated outer membrane protein [Burkholderiales bacterium]|nr:TIGR03016 family PEP-CTERM system-associated outer membrane protein [Burkholderiales bacterium]
MATTHHETRHRLSWLALALAAQSIAPIALAQTHSVTPTLGARASVSDNATQAADGATKRSETTLSVSPGLNLAYRSANSRLEGQVQLTSVNYLEGTQADRVLPTGLVLFRTDLGGQGFGLDASLAAEQVRSTFGAVTAGTPNTADSYTNTRFRISPFLDRPLSEFTRLTARLERTQVRSSANDDALASRPNTHTDGASVRLLRRPTRIGYALDANYQDDRAGQASTRIYTERLAKATLLYALTPEIEVGAFAGRESSQVFSQRFSDSVKGLQLSWRPGERTQVELMAEDRFYGRGWLAQVSHRTPFLAFGVNTSRQVDTYTNNVGGTLTSSGGTRGLLDAILTTRIPDEAERRRAVEELMLKRNLPAGLGSSRDLYDLNAQLRQATSARLAFMGRRTITTLATGFNRAAPVDQASATSILGPGNRTREQYSDLDVNHRLTPLTVLNGGLRWSRTRTAGLTLLGSEVRTREFAVRAGLGLTLSPQSTLTFGMRHQRGQAGNANRVIENIVFVGLDHRF